MDCAELNRGFSRCPDAQIAEPLARAENDADSRGRICLYRARPPEIAAFRADERLFDGEDCRAVGDWRVNILNAEMAFYTGNIPKLLLPFQRNRFANDLLLVCDLREARVCFIAAGF